MEPISIAALIITSLISGGTKMWAQNKANKEAQRAGAEARALGEEQAAEDKMYANRNYSLQARAQKFNEGMSTYDMRQQEQRQAAEMGIQWLNQNQSILQQIVNRRRG